MTSTAVYEIRPVHTPCEMRRVWKLRYDIYVREMKRQEPHADHQNGWLSDCYDSESEVLAAFCGNSVVGAVRGVPGSSLSREDGEFWRVPSAGEWHPRGTTAITKLVVDPRYRGGLLTVRLCQQLFVHMYLLGHRFAFIDCNTPRRRLFEGIGFEQLGPTRTHATYGPVHIMAMRMADWNYLSAIRSPCYRKTKKLKHDAAASIVSINQMNADYRSIDKGES